MPAASEMLLGGAESLAGAFRLILLETLGAATSGTEETPERAAKAWLELTAGYQVDVPGLFTTFDAEGYDEMIGVVGIPYTSLCEHHLLSFSGVVHVVYLPTDKIVGLSKIPRAVDAFARRLQNQERLTANVADALTENLDPLGVLVQAEGRHSCMCARGAKSEGLMITSVTRGAMRDKPETRAEALAMIETWRRSR